LILGLCGDENHADIGEPNIGEPQVLQHLLTLASSALKRCSNGHFVIVPSRIDDASRNVHNNADQPGIIHRHNRTNILTKRGIRREVREVATPITKSECAR
jgi:hypothetical protein